MNLKEKFKNNPKKWLFIGALVLIAPYVLGATGIFAMGSWRYEMTVVVETPEGIKTGSAVRQVSNVAMFDILNFPGAGNPASFKGEAVVVDLGERGYLFSLLNGPGFNRVYSNPYGSSTPKGINYYNWHVDRKKKILNSFEYPTFVTFKDIKDPKSVRIVYKTNLVGRDYQITDNTAEILGEGIRIKEVAVKRVQRSITRKIDDILKDDFWEERRKWNAQEKENWKKTIFEAGGLNNMNELEKERLFEKTNLRKLVRKNSFKQGE